MNENGHFVKAFHIWNTIDYSTFINKGGNISNKFESNEMVIRRMVDFALKDGFSLEETILFIEDFFNAKSMQ